MSLAVVVGALWAMLPAYVPNNAAVLAGGGRPIDCGRMWDGKRVLGDGKTWRGTLAGTLAGTLLALVLNPLNTTVARAVGFALPVFPVRVAVALAFGAMLGDIGASFLKRRTGRERGAAFPGLDQLDFVVGALGLTALVAPGWFASAFPLLGLLAVLIATPVLHVVTNVAAYLLGFKNEPW